MNKNTKALFRILVALLCGSLEAVAAQNKTATAVAEVSNGSVKKIILTEGGAGYEQHWVAGEDHYNGNPVVEITGGGGKGAKAVVNVRDGEITMIGLMYESDGGTGYTSNPEVKIESPQEAHNRATAERNSRLKALEDERAVEIRSMWMGALRFLAVVTALALTGRFIARKFKPSKYNVQIQKRYPLAAAAVVILTLVIWVMKDGKLGPWAEKDQPGNAQATVDPSPVGTWIDGDTSTVCNRLTVSSSGYYRFETVDFTGDVKGGHSGRWRLNGDSVHYIYDGGEITGFRSGQNGLSYGATTFYRR